MAHPDHESDDEVPSGPQGLRQRHIKGQFDALQHRFGMPQYDADLQRAVLSEGRALPSHTFLGVGEEDLNYRRFDIGWLVVFAGQKRTDTQVVAAYCQLCEVPDHTAHALFSASGDDATEVLHDLHEQLRTHFDEQHEGICVPDASLFFTGPSDPATPMEATEINYSMDEEKIATQPRHSAHRTTVTVASDLGNAVYLHVDSAQQTVWATCTCGELQVIESYDVVGHVEASWDLTVHTHHTVMADQGPVRPHARTYKEARRSVTYAASQHWQDRHSSKKKVNLVP